MGRRYSYPRASHQEAVGICLEVCEFLKDDRLPLVMEHQDESGAHVGGYSATAVRLCMKKRRSLL